MMTLTEDLQAEIVAHAHACMPREACGLVVIQKGRARWWPGNNLAVGSDQFVLDPRDYAAADEAGDIVAVVHSHPYLPADPSQADRVACEASGLPWHIVSVPEGRWATLAPSGYRAPLVGREWSHGVLDCYAIIRDWYALERAVTLPDFVRFDDWWRRGENLYIDNFIAAGFYPLIDEQPEPGDVILMQVMSPVPNHGAIYLGDDIMLHHVQHRLSCRDVYGGMWRKHTTHVLRYGR